MLDKRKISDGDIEILKDEIKGRFRKGIEEGRSFRSAKRVIKGVAAAVAVTVGVTAAGCFASPTFAKALSELPGINLILDFVSREKNLGKAEEMGQGKQLDIHYEEGEYKLNILYGIRDRTKLSLGYTLLGKDREQVEFSIGLHNVFLKNEEGEEIPINCIERDSDFGSGFFDLRDISKRSCFEEYHTENKWNLNEMDGEIFLSFDIKRFIDEDYEKIMSVEDLAIPIGEMEKSQGYAIEVDKEISIGKQEVNVKGVYIEPTEMGINFELAMKVQEKRRLKNIEVVLEDENGVEYTEIQDTGLKNAFIYSQKNISEDSSITCEAICLLNSPYYENIKELKIKRIFMDYYSEEKIRIDIDNGEVLSSTWDEISLSSIKRDGEAVEITLISKEKIGHEGIRYKNIILEGSETKKIQLPQEEHILKEGGSRVKYRIPNVEKGTIVTIDYLREDERNREKYEDGLIIEIESHK